MGAADGRGSGIIQPADRIDVVLHAIVCIGFHQHYRPVYVICYSAGDEEPAYFRRLFKRTTGLIPGGYRKEFRVTLDGR